MRFGGGEGCKSHRGLAPPPDGSVVKWNLFDSRPLFHLTPLPPAARGRLSVLAKAKPVCHGSGSALWFCLGYGLLYWLPDLIGLGLGLNPIGSVTEPYWMRVVGREVGWQARLDRFRLRWRAVAIETRGCVVIPSHPPPLAVAASAAKPPSGAWPHPLKKRIYGLTATMKLARMSINKRLQNSDHFILLGTRKL